MSDPSQFRQGPLTISGGRCNAGQVISYCFAACKLSHQHFCHWIYSRSENEGNTKYFQLKRRQRGCTISGFLMKSVGIFSKLLCIFCVSCEWVTNSQYLGISWGCMYSEWPWKVEIVSSSYEGQVYLQPWKLRVSLLKWNPVVYKHPVGASCVALWAREMPRYTDAHAARLGWVIKFFVSDPGVLCHLPASMKLAG